ncbi:MotA/TolQ/ExbB proton channel family protein [Piscirickettsia litoralis]|uniref:Biopolymer transporter ExbB n=1 Tax=Piscirickettsia litoralis TaxID=1891921 RepID=A0ABX3A3P7_9GAMM|nr:MotA/TolQ/ExbB proton channel family protein [Piscirickettsia litoralis]ODN42055.1 biopolymer transporter ExbB [Piscirickettsia litoralis]
MNILQSLETLYQQVSSVGLLLIIMGAFTLSVLLLKAWQFNRLRLSKLNFIELVIQTVRAGQYAEALEHLTSIKHPVASVLQALIQKKFQQHESTQQIETEVQRVGEAKLSQLESYLRPIEVMSNLAPLVGLLGTVLGIIMAFSAVKSATYVDPGQLSNGISHALVTTALGLCVAIPAQIGFHYLDSIVEKVRLAMSDSVAQLMQQSAIVK